MLYCIVLLSVLLWITIPFICFHVCIFCVTGTSLYTSSCKYLLPGVRIYCLYMKCHCYFVFMDVPDLYGCVIMMVLVIFWLLLTIVLFLGSGADCIKSVQWILVISSNYKAVGIFVYLLLIYIVYIWKHVVAVCCCMIVIFVVLPS